MKSLYRILSLILAILFCFSLDAQNSSSLRNRISLDGTWDFTLASDGKGEKGKIQVPGIWDAQGYGQPTDKVRHNFVGKGWYQRQLHIPSDWSSHESRFLVLTGISRYAKVWIEGTLVGPEAIGCIGSHEWDISELIKPGGTAQLTICVDSRQRWDIDPLLGTAQLNDFVEVAWGGLWGHVYVESRPQSRLDDIYLRTRLGYATDGNVCKTECGLRATLYDKQRRASVNGTLKLELVTPEGKTAASSSRPLQIDLSSGKADVEIWMDVPEAHLWTPDTPYLYTARVTWTSAEGVTDELEHRYGMREIQFSGSQVLLNGHPLYLRGYGDDHIYPEQFSMSTDIDVYRQRLRAIKSYGFNHCRHHSIVMPHEYYQACDELGMLPIAEMLIAYSPQLPGHGDLWKRNVPEGTSPEPAQKTIVERFQAVVHEYKNHPSIFLWCGGNEMGLEWDYWSQATLRRQCQQVARREDPDRHFMDSDGDWLKDYVAHGGRDTEDCYSILFDEWCNPILNPGKYQSPKSFDKPAIAHEMGNYLTFSRVDEIPLFEKTNFFPFWMQEGSERLKKLGLYDEVEQWACASEQLYLLLHKYNTEAARRNGNLTGYHWWQINDYWTSSNGLFDHFFRSKSIRPEDVLPFNDAVVLLQDSLRFSYVEGDRITLYPMVSNYSTHALSGTLSCQLRVGNHTVGQQRSPVNEAPAGKLTGLPSARFTCPRVKRPQQAVVSIQLQTADTTYCNTWTAWLFPQRIAPKTSRPVYADGQTLPLLPAEWNVHPLSQLSGTYPSHAVYVVSGVSTAIDDAVRRGAGLIHMGGNDLFTSLRVDYKQSWWKAGDSEEANNTGTFVYPSPVVQDVTDLRFCGAAWASLIDGAQKFDIESSQKRPEVIIRALSSIVRVRDQALLMQFAYGKGRVIVDGLNHAAAKGEPLNSWILARMIDESQNTRRPTASCDIQSLVPSVTLPDGTTLGMEQVTECAETMQHSPFWSTTGSSKQWICRQTEPGNRLAWVTDIPQQPLTGNVTFVFAGALGWATQPATDGFALSLNGADLILFDVLDDFAGTADTYSWKSMDSRSTLEFHVVSQAAPNDKYGIFRLTLPHDLIISDQRQSLSVRSLGKDSRRWFSVQSYSNLLFPTNPDQHQ